MPENTFMPPRRRLPTRADLSALLWVLSRFSDRSKMADAVGASEATLSSYFYSGGNPMLTDERLTRLAEAFGLDPVKLIKAKQRR